MTKTRKKDNYSVDFATLTAEELVESYVFPANQPLHADKKMEEHDFWNRRRQKFHNRTPVQKMHANLLQLKFQLEDYISSKQYIPELNFGYFLHEYISRQEKKDKEFATEVDVTAAVLSQYINNHRKPKNEFIIRLELHSNGMIPAISWFKVIQKDKEYEISTNQDIRREESKHVKNHLAFTY